MRLRAESPTSAFLLLAAVWLAVSLGGCSSDSAPGCEHSNRPVDGARSLAAAAELPRIGGSVARWLGLAESPHVTQVKFVTDASDARIAHRGIGGGFDVETKELLIRADGPRELDNLIIAHELVHAGLREKGIELPHWVEEGFCDVVALGVEPQHGPFQRATRSFGVLVATGGLRLLVRAPPTDTAPFEEFVVEFSGELVAPASVLDDEGCEDEENSAQCRGLAYLMVDALRSPIDGDEVHVLECVTEALVDEANPDEALRRLGLPTEPEKWRERAAGLVGSTELSWMLTLDHERIRKGIEAELQRRAAHLRMCS
jgi:hypothetical protein